MKITIRRTAGFLGVALMAAQLFGSVNTQAPGMGGSSSAFAQARPTMPAQKEIENLFKEISSNAAIAGRQAEALESMTRGAGKLRHQTHAAELMRAKEAINDMGADFRRLQELRSSALPWQELVMDRMEPVLLGLAGQTTIAIERLNLDRRGLPSQEYRDAVANMYFLAGQARNLIVVNLNYAQAREKLNQLDASAMQPVTNVSAPAEAAAAPSKPSKSLEQRVSSELLKLPYYGVFDHLVFQIDGDHVTLSGKVHRPTIKTDAERAVRGVEGIAGVTDKVEVLPLSPNDDRMRMAVYRAIYGHSTLARYRLNPHPPIRIIVDNGNVTLMGVVGSEMDRTIANMQADTVPGAFSVTNNLQIGS